MYTKTIKTALIKRGLAVSVLLLGSGAAFGQTASLATSGTGAVDVGASPIPVTEVITLTAATGTPFDANSVSTSIVAPFSQDLSACNNGSLITSCTINVTATPTAPGPVSQPVTITATTGGGVNIVTLTSVVTLTATGILPTVNPSGPSLTFTDPGPGKTATQTVTLSNIADTAVAFTWTLNATGSYALDPSSTCTPSPTSLSGAAGTCTIIVDFNSPPTGIDPGTASLTVTQTGSSANPSLASIAFAEQNPGAVAVGAGGTVEVELTAAPTSITLPDGTTAPMWGYRCMNSAACSALNPNAGGNWSPVVITALAGQTLAIDLTNSLSFANGTTSPTLVPTSLVIVGQLGGGLGSPTTAGSPVHSSQVVTWSTVGSNPVFTPPPQGNRVQ